MRLTSFTDFGLRALMRMASAPDRAFSTAELAAEFALSRNHLTKIMAALAQAGIVTTRRDAAPVAARRWRVRPAISVWARLCGCWRQVNRLSSVLRPRAEIVRSPAVAA
jgi:Iron-dependent Transcriptional regulator